MVMFLTLLLAYSQLVQAQAVSNNCSSIRKTDSIQQKGTIRLEFWPSDRVKNEMENSLNVTVNLLYKADGEWKTVANTSKDTNTNRYSSTVRVNHAAAAHRFQAKVTLEKPCLSPVLTVNMKVDIPVPEIIGAKAIGNCSSCLQVENNVNFTFECRTNAPSNTSAVYVKLDGNIIKTFSEERIDKVVGHAFITLNHHMKLLECVVHHWEYNLTLAATAALQVDMRSNNCSSIRMIDYDKERGTIKLEYWPSARSEDVTVKLLYNADGEWKTVADTSKDTMAVRINDRYTSNVIVNHDMAVHSFQAEVILEQSCLSPLLTVNMKVDIPAPEILGAKVIGNCSSCLLVGDNAILTFKCRTNAPSSSSEVYFKLDGNAIKSVTEKSSDIVVGYVYITLNHHMKLMECVVHHRKHNLTLATAANLYVAVAPGNVTLEIEQDFGKTNATCIILGGRPPANVELSVPGVATNISALANVNKAYDASTKSYNVTASVLLTNPSWKRLMCCASNAASKVPECRNATFAVGVQVSAENLTAPELNMTLLAISIGLLSGTVAMSAICAAVLAWKGNSVTITEPARTPPIPRGPLNKREVTPSLPPRVNVSANLPGQQRSRANAGPVNPPAGAHGPPKELVYADLDLHNDLGAHRRTPTVRQVSKSEYADIDFTRKATQTVDNRVFEEDFAND